MYITSSRKPSASTRTLCKHLASFFGCEYFNRGKMSMGEVLNLSHDTPLLIVGEYHGNPGSIVFYDGKAFCVLSIYLSVLTSPSAYPRRDHSVSSIEGDNEIIPILRNLLLPEKMDESSSLLKLEISGNTMDFKNSDKNIFSLRMKSYKVYDGDEDCS